jgi:CMP-N-acetylneuraminic acid synthetase
LKNLLITICGRGGSKGIPGKNICLIGNQPLIAYSIETAQNFTNSLSVGEGWGEVVLTLSTDAEEIKNVAAQFGLQTNYVRPDEMATDTAGKLPVLKHILNWEEEQKNIRFDYVLDLDITSPLRTVDDLQAAFNILQQDENALNLFSVNNAHRNPYFNMVEQNETGYYSLVKKLPDGVVTRQAAPKVYDMNASFYFYKRSFFDSDCKTAISPTSLIYTMPHLCFDLDEPVDFLFMEYLIENRKLGFEL